MNVAKRVQDLEKRMGAEDNQTLLRLSFVGCNPEMTGAERAREHQVVAFKTTDGAQRWDLRTGETEGELWERAKSEVRYPEWGVAVLMECYENETELSEV